MNSAEMQATLLYWFYIFGFAMAWKYAIYPLLTQAACHGVHLILISLWFCSPVNNRPSRLVHGVQGVVVANGAVDIRLCPGCPHIAVAAAAAGVLGAERGGVQVGDANGALLVERSRLELDLHGCLFLGGVPSLRTTAWSSKISKGIMTLA